MSHARRREGADVPKGYKEEPAPVADDLVSAPLSFSDYSTWSRGRRLSFNSFLLLSLHINCICAVSPPFACSSPLRSIVSALDAATRAGYPRLLLNAAVWLHGMPFFRQAGWHQPPHPLPATPGCPPALPCSARRPQRTTRSALSLLPAA